MSCNYWTVIWKKNNLHVGQWYWMISAYYMHISIGISPCSIHSFYNILLYCSYFSLWHYILFTSLWIYFCVTTAQEKITTSLWLVVKIDLHKPSASKQSKSKMNTINFEHSLTAWLSGTKKSSKLHKNIKSSTPWWEIWAIRIQDISKKKRNNSWTISVSDCFSP